MNWRVSFDAAAALSRVSQASPAVERAQLTVRPAAAMQLQQMQEQGPEERGKACPERAPGVVPWQLPLLLSPLDR